MIVDEYNADPIKEVVKDEVTECLKQSLFLLFVFITGYFVGGASLMHKYQNDAVDHGFASYVTNQIDKTIEFKWNTNR